MKNIEEKLQMVKNYAKSKGIELLEGRSGHESVDPRAMHLKLGVRPTEADIAALLDTVKDVTNRDWGAKRIYIYRKPLRVVNNYGNIINVDFTRKKRGLRNG
jgi:hypothetical protein